MIQISCKECSKEFSIYQCHLGKIHFCSKECRKLFYEAKKIKKNCVQCGKEFSVFPSEEAKIFCSKSCARTNANLTDKNPSFHRDVSGANNPMFGKQGLKGANNPMFGKRREASPRWTGGRKVRRDEYVLVVAPDEHPNPSDYNKSTGLKYILEHRLVMEKHLGRYLLPEEVVHHADENPSNNKIENLILCANQDEHAKFHNWGKK